MIDIHHVSITKDKKTILHNISYNVKNKSCTVIIGSNGAGKTCLLQAITGNIRANSWSITIQTHHRWYCTDTWGINPNLTPYEQRSLTQKVANRQRNNKTQQQWVDRLEMNQQIHNPIHTLSEWNKQKVAIINSLVHDPLLVIRDEPTQHLDPWARYTVHQLMQHLKDQWKTIVYTTHFLEDIGQHTDRYLILNQWYIYKQGELSDHKEIQNFFQKN